MTVPAHFDVATCASDFAGPGRRIAVHTPRGYGRRGMHVHVGRWTISVQWGFGTYSTAGRGATTGADCPTTSLTAEVAAWPVGGDMITIVSDTVEGYQTPAAVEAAIVAALADDQDAIRFAFVDGAVAS